MVAYKHLYKHSHKQYSMLVPPQAGAQGTNQMHPNGGWQWESSKDVPQWRLIVVSSDAPQATVEQNSADVPNKQSTIESKMPQQ